MCGIAGQAKANQKPVERQRLAAMGAQLQHRGPDDHGLYINSHVGLAHRRLSVLDLTPAGRQPMSNENGTVWIVFNGEIYNCQELRSTLQSRHSFRSRTDTEVIVHLYEEYGLQCLSMLRGMFAFAIWDELNQRLILARDRLGKKPLYYSVNDQSLTFASELKALLVGCPVPEIDPVALHHYLTFQYVPTPMTIFRGIQKLRPGHVLVYEKGKVSESAYWTLQYDDKLVRLSDAEYQERFLSLFRESVRLRLASDVPLGAFLSGGLDSSSIVALMTQEATRPVKTFSIGFKDKAFDELPYAREVAEQFHTEHHEFVVEPSVIEILPTLVRVYDEPFADSSAIPTYYVSQRTHEFVTVILNGDGGDELLGGYPRYHFGTLQSLALRAFELNKGITVATDRLRRLLASFHTGDEATQIRPNWLARAVEPLSRRYLERISYFTAAEKEWLYTPEFRQIVESEDTSEMMIQWFDEAQAMGQLDRLLEVDTRSYLPDDLLVKVDRATMAHGLEARSPLLDHKLVEFVAALPVDQKVRRGRTKHVLREAMRGWLPDRTLDREKKGFSVPIDRWFREDCREFVRDHLLSDRCMGRGYFRTDRVRQLIEQHEQSRTNHGCRLYALLMLELWHREYVDRASCTN
ncbi:MAG: asparagine synthase (glutamine-hydrolyzing) [Nitrospiraceae bacterium]